MDAMEQRDEAAIRTWCVEILDRIRQQQPFIVRCDPWHEPLTPAIHVFCDPDDHIAYNTGKGIAKGITKGTEEEDALQTRISNLMQRLLEEAQPPGYVEKGTGKACGKAVCKDLGETIGNGFVGAGDLRGPYVGASKGKGKDKGAKAQGKGITRARVEFHNFICHMRAVVADLNEGMRTGMRKGS